MITLLDVNVLIALTDGGHVHHEPAKRFFRSIQRDGWATCPLTENGFLRIMGHPNFAAGLKGLQEARLLLDGLMQQPGHQFWGDDCSLSDAAMFPQLTNSKHLTDQYLLGLAVKHQGRLATFDRQIETAWVKGGETAIWIIPAE